MKKFDEITFSQEELIYLLRTLNLPDLAGMGDRPWGHIPEENALLMMETVGRGLVARGIIHFGNGKMEVEDDVARLLSDCAYPHQMTALTHGRGKAQLQQLYLRGNKHDIEHSIPHPWVHHFSIKPKSDMGLSNLQMLIEDAPLGKTGTAFHIQQTKLDEIRQLSLSNATLANQQLLDTGVPSSMSEKLVNVLRTPDIKIIVQVVYELKNKVRQNIFSIMADSESCWLMLAEQPGAQAVQVMSVDRKKLNQMILASFQPFDQE